MAWYGEKSSDLLLRKTRGGNLGKKMHLISQTTRMRKRREEGKRFVTGKEKKEMGEKGGGRRTSY